FRGRRAFERNHLGLEGAKLCRQIFLSRLRHGDWDGYLLAGNHRKRGDEYRAAYCDLPSGPEYALKSLWHGMFKSFWARYCQSNFRFDFVFSAYTLGRQDIHFHLRRHESSSCSDRTAPLPPRGPRAIADWRLDQRGEGS